MSGQVKPPVWYWIVSVVALFVFLVGTLVALMSPFVWGYCPLLFVVATRREVEGGGALSPALAVSRWWRHPGDVVHHTGRFFDCFDVIISFKIGWWPSCHESHPITAFMPCTHLGCRSITVHDYLMELPLNCGPFSPRISILLERRKE